MTRLIKVCNAIDEKKNEHFFVCVWVRANKLNCCKMVWKKCICIICVYGVIIIRFASVPSFPHIWPLYFNGILIYELLINIDHQFALSIKKGNGYNSDNNNQIRNEKKNERPSNEWYRQRDKIWWNFDRDQATGWVMMLPHTFIYWTNINPSIWNFMVSQIVLSHIRVLSWWAFSSCKP